MAHNVMRRFRLDKIAAVDRPAQQHAKVVIMKRDDSDDALAAFLKRAPTDAEIAAGEAMADGFVIKNRDDLALAIRAVDQAADVAKAKNHIVARARALDATSVLPTDWHAAKSVGGDLVIKIAAIAPRVLPDLLADVAKVEEIEAQVAKLTDKTERVALQQSLQVAKSAVIAAAWSILDNSSSEDAPSLLRKNFEEYKDHALGLVPGGGSTTKRASNSGDESMALKDIAKGLGLKDDATEAEILKAIEKRDAELALNTALAKMSGKHKSFMENDKAKMPAGGKDKFAAMTAEERDAHMSANPLGDSDVDKRAKDDEILKVDGTEIRKSEVGASVFAVMKSQQAAIEKAADDAAVGVIEKRVTPLKHVIGKAADVAGLLHRIAKGRSTQADADSVETLLKSANEVMAKNNVITKEFGGSGSGSFAKAVDEIAAKAEELRKANPKLSIEKAKTQVRDANPELVKREQDEAKEARRAA